MLRETKGDVPAGLWGLAMAFIALLWALFTAGLALGLGRIARRSGIAAPAPAAPAPA